ncbi:tyrosine 2,3-aminomutase [Streptomyces sp. NPDC046727]|uniref:tyrosine 2,3-aminomutase n=1 Tax=Streptomyces sp. NPDC046727 TaxID=3155373 RepID=UPI0033CD5D66
MIIKGDGLTVDDLYAVAAGGESVELDDSQLSMVDDTCARLQKWGAEGHPIYGVTTGFGEMVFMSIPSKFETTLQENLLRTHAAGGGPLFPDEVVRAIQVARLNCLMKGYSGIGSDALRLMGEFLNRGIHPLVPEQGSLGASGDLAPLSHLALPLIAAGRVRYRGTVREAKDVLAEQGLAPARLGYKDGLALINGTSGMTGVAALALVRARRLMRLALWASAAFVQVMGGSTRAFDARGHELKNHQGQNAVARHVRQLLDGSELTREHEDVMRLISEQKGDSGEVTQVKDYLQNAYTLRCIPQILGPVLDTMDYCRRLVEEELNSCNDNPLIFDSPETIFHGGHFHGQYVAMAGDFFNIAVTEIGVLAERQLNRILDPHLNKAYPAFLALGDEGLYSGLQGSQYLATSIASENLDLAAPASVKTIPSNGQNQDVVSMGLIAARKSLKLIENVTTIVGVLVAACYQAATITGIHRFSPQVRGLLELLADTVPGYRDDNGVAADFLAAIRAAVLDERAERLLPTIDFAAGSSAGVLA